MGKSWTTVPTLGDDERLVMVEVHPIDQKCILEVALLVDGSPDFIIAEDC